MTRIIIEGVDDRMALLSALSVVMDVFNHDTAYDRTEHVFAPDESDDSIASGEHPDSGSEPCPPVALIPCAHRGEHHQLTDCWMCWCDVMRGAALEPEVLAPEAWMGDIANT